MSSELEGCTIGTLTRLKKKRYSLKYTIKNNNKTIGSSVTREKGKLLSHD